MHCFVSKNTREHCWKLISTVHLICKCFVVIWSLSWWEKTATMMLALVYKKLCAASHLTSLRIAEKFHRRSEKIFTRVCKTRTVINWPPQLKFHFTFLYADDNEIWISEFDIKCDLRHCATCDVDFRIVFADAIFDSNAKTFVLSFKINFLSFAAVTFWDAETAITDR